MNKIYYIVLLVLAMTACETIPENERDIHLDPVAWEGSDRAHLLIEYTGVQCVNCPLAADEAHRLLEIYPENLVVVSMQPASNPLTKASAQYDLTCPEADTYYKMMGGTATTSFPTGSINMMAESDGNYFFDYSSWSTRLSKLMVDSADIIPTINAGWLPEDSMVSINIHLTPRRDVTLPYDVRVLVWLVENDIVGAQYMPDGQPNLEYVHQHILRTVVDGEQGMDLQVNSRVGTDYSTSLRFKDKWKRENCQIVVVVTDQDMSEVLNVRQTVIQ